MSATSPPACCPAAWTACVAARSSCAAMPARAVATACAAARWCCMAMRATSSPRAWSPVRSRSPAGWGTLRLRHAPRHLGVCRPVACGPVLLRLDASRYRRFLDIAAPQPRLSWRPFCGAACPRAVPPGGRPGGGRQGRVAAARLRACRFRRRKRGWRLDAPEATPPGHRTPRTGRAARARPHPTSRKEPRE